MGPSTRSASVSAARLLLVTLLSLPCIPAPAQAPAADYTADLPSVQRVETEIRGSDATDSVARQVAIFNYLYAYIGRIKYNRTVTGPYTPGEEKMVNAYRLAAWQLSQDYTKTHTAEQTTAFNRLHGQYEEDSDFYKDWSKRLIGPQSAAAYKGAEAGLGATQKAHIDAINKANQEAQAQSTNAQGLSNDPTAIATRRCLELGGNALACTGKSFMSGLLGMTGINLDAIAGPARAGIVLSGVYGPSTATSVSFSGNTADVLHCGVLEPATAAYTLTKSGPGVEVTVAIEPRPLTLSMRSDGSLNGPGLITLNGRIISGYTTTTHEVLVNGASAAAQGYDCNGPCTTSSSSPIYKPKTDRCTVNHLAAPPAPSPSASNTQQGELISGLTSFMGTIVAGSLPGLRMEGKYTSSNGLLLDFDGETVTLDCGQAHVKAPYTVENGPTHFIIHIDNAGSPFALTVDSDNLLRGAGSATINGRLVSGMSGNDVTFIPHAETCAIGAFSPQGSATSTTTTATNAPPPTPTAPLTPAPASTPTASPATSGPRAAFRVLLGSSFSGTNPLTGQTIFVMRKPIDEVLRELSIPVPANANAAAAMKAFQAFCQRQQGCSDAITGLRTYYITGTKLDATGNATLSATAATGSYYFFAVAPPTAGSLVWDIPATLVAGDNKVTFTDANAQHI